MTIGHYHNHHDNHLSPPVNFINLPSSPSLITSNGIGGRPVGHKFMVASSKRILMIMKRKVNGTFEYQWQFVSVKLVSPDLSLLMIPWVITNGLFILVAFYLFLSGTGDRVFTFFAFSILFTHLLVWLFKLFGLVFKMISREVVKKHGPDRNQMWKFWSNFPLYKRAKTFSEKITTPWP